MIEILERLRDLLRSRQLTNEAQIKMAVILPILRALDWDHDNPKEFVPEYPVALQDGSHGSVDYALFGDEIPGGRRSPMVFVEAKRLGNVTVSGVEQVFTYAANRGVPFLILTDGNIWDFYLSMAVGAPADRRFLRIELERDDRLLDHARFLDQYLRKGRVGRPETRLDAERLLRDDRQRRLAGQAIPAVWRSLLESPDESLIDLITDAVARKCGFPPAFDDVTTFLKECALPSSPISEVDPRRQRPLKRVRQEEPSDPVIVGPPSTPSPPRPQRPPQIRGFVLDGERTVTGSAREALTELVKKLHLLDKEFMARFAIRTSGRTRRLVATTRDQLYDNADIDLDQHSRDLNNGWWIGTNLSQALIRKHIATACEVMGISLGSRLTLIER